MRKALFSFFLSIALLHPLSSNEESGHVINFRNVQIKEFVRFVSRVANVNFIFDDELLDFNVTLVSGKSTTPSDILVALSNLLHQHHLTISEEDNYLIIQKMTENDKNRYSNNRRQNHSSALEGFNSLSSENEFHVHKLQYHEGDEILEALKQFSPSSTSTDLVQSIQSLQWIKTSNSLLFSGEPDTLARMTNLIKSLDKPYKQVFIEVLVIETDVRNSMDFGLQWGASQNFGNHLTASSGFSGAQNGTPSLLNTLQNGGALTNGRGFDLSVIGDLIFHKGRSFLSLGALLSALQSDGDSTIVLNQKIIAQDNRNAKIFVGNNIPFAGSVIETIGASQQTTSNIEYRDVGVCLNIKPLLGENEIISLEISQEISDALRLPSHTNQVNGIETTKTEMLTKAHVPDKHFLVLSGMVRNNKINRVTGVPVLSKIPLIGALFRKTTQDDEKRNLIIFVRPQIIHSVEDHKAITEKQEALCQALSQKQDVLHAINLIKPSELQNGPNSNNLAFTATSSDPE
ncbi:MAG: secretin N-terminal domain-containing protein [Simkaniaceae bacterium]